MPSSPLHSKGYNNALSASVAEVVRPIQSAPSGHLLNSIVAQHSAATQIGTDHTEITGVENTMAGLLVLTIGPLIEAWNKLPTPNGIASAIAFFNRAN